MIKIPALLVKTIEDLNENIKLFAPRYNRFQIDICDDLFVPNKTIDIDDLKKIESSTSNSFDFHLMVNDYEKEISKIEKLNIKINIVFIHLKTLFTLPKSNLFNIGLVINPEEEIKKNFEIINKFENIQIMSVIPGFQNQEFIPNSLSKINELKTLGYQGQIYLDGGINESSIALIEKNAFKPDFLCIGSYLKKTIDFTSAV